MQAVLLALLIFQIKHFLCDFAFQTYDQVKTKGIYLHLGGLSHAGLHMLGSIPALLILGPAPALMAALLVGEFLVHYHTDWAKSQIDGRLRLNDTNSLYWTIFGSDQLVHQATYLAMTYLALRFA
ncbi:MAG: DUF3307 domain-containing protein [Rhizomicrobium sp.]